MYYSEQHGLRPADKLVEPIFATGITKHHSIYLGIDRNGVEWMSESHAPDGVRLVKAQDYFSRNKPFRIERFPGNDAGRKAAVKRAFRDLGKPYNLVNYNCEHHASFVQTGFAESKQVLLAAGMLIIILIIGLARAD